MFSKKVRMFFLVVFLTLFFNLSSVFAGSITLIWDANNEPDLAGYRVYYGLSTGDYLPEISVGNVTTYTVEDLAPDTYYLAVTACDDSGLESTYSNEVFGTVENRPPGSPGGCLIFEIQHD